MKRVEKVNVVRRLGRPPKAGEHYSGPGSPCIYIRGPGAPESSFVMPYCEAVEITPEDREYEGDVPVPSWIEDLGGPDVPYSLLRSFASAYRAEVAKRAKEAAKASFGIDGNRRWIENLILDAFLGGKP